MDTKQAEIIKRRAYDDIKILSGFQAKSKIPGIYAPKIKALKDKINRLEKRTPRK